MKDYRGRYTTTSMSPLKWLLVSFAGCWLLMWFGENYEVKAKGFISPASDAIVIREVEPGLIEYRDREIVTVKIPQTNEEIIRSVFGDKADEALKVAKCESGMNPKAKNKDSSARGLFQVLSYTHGIRQDWLFDPLINSLVAKQLYDNRGNWGAWAASNGCHHLLDE